MPIATRVPETLMRRQETREEGGHLPARRANGNRARDSSSEIRHRYRVVIRSSLLRDVEDGTLIEIGVRRDTRDSPFFSIRVSEFDAYTQIKLVWRKTMELNSSHLS